MTFWGWWACALLFHDWKEWYDVTARCLVRECARCHNKELVADVDRVDKW